VAAGGGLARGGTGKGLAPGFCGGAWRPGRGNPVGFIAALPTDADLHFDRLSIQYLHPIVTVCGRRELDVSCM
jgi:hypothetical protein